MSPPRAPEPLLTPAFVLVSVAHALQSLALNLHVHLPGFLQGLGAREMEIGAIYAAMSAAAIASRPWVGRAMDGRGRMVVIVGGSVLHVLVSGLYLTVSSLGAWIVCVRVLHGVAEGMLFSSLFAYAADIVPASRRTHGIAVFGVSGLLPIALGGVLGDLVLARAGYRELFLLVAVLALFGLLAALPLRETAPRASSAVRRPFLSVALEPQLLPMWFIGTGFATSIAGVFVFLKTYVLETRVGSVGLFLSAYCVAASLLRLGFGWLPDRIGPKRALYPAIAALAGGLVLLARARSSADVAIAGTLAGFGHGFSFPILAGMVVTRARPQERGTAIATFTAVFDTGVLVGGPLLGWVAQSAGYRPMYLVAAGLALAFIATFAVWDRRVPCA